MYGADKREYNYQQEIHALKTNLYLFSQIFQDANHIFDNTTKKSMI